jgi:hypothetical protein
VVTARLSQVRLGDTPRGAAVIVRGPLASAFNVDPQADYEHYTAELRGAFIEIRPWRPLVNSKQGGLLWFSPGAHRITIARYGYLLLRAFLKREPRVPRMWVRGE